MWSLLHGSKIKFCVVEVISAFWFLTFELPLLLEVPKEPDVDDERHDGRQGDAEAHEDGEALAEGDRVLPLLVVCGQIRKFNKRRAPRWLPLRAISSPLLQGDHSGRSLGVVDIKTKVAF